VVVESKPKDEVTVVLDREVAERLVKRIKHPFHVNVASEADFQELLTALESALGIAWLAPGRSSPQARRLSDRTPVCGG